MKETIQELSSDDESDEDSNENDIESDVSQLPEKDDNEIKKVPLEDCEETIIPRSVGDSSATPRYGSAPVYIINGKPTPVAHHTHYAYRNVGSSTPVLLRIYWNHQRSPKMNAFVVYKLIISKR